MLIWEFHPDYGFSHYCYTSKVLSCYQVFLLVKLMGSIYLHIYELIYYHFAGSVWNMTVGWNPYLGLISVRLSKFCSEALSLELLRMFVYTSIIIYIGRCYTSIIISSSSCCPVIIIDCQIIYGVSDPIELEAELRRQEERKIILSWKMKKKRMVYSTMTKTWYHTTR